MRAKHAPPAIRIIRAAREMAGITTDKELCERTGINLSRWNHERIPDPDSFRLFELKAIRKETNMSPELWEALYKA